MPFEELTRGDGTMEVTGYGRKLMCPVCNGDRFHERNSLLNTRVATFFKFDWANKDATNYICANCGYIYWFFNP